MIRAMVINEWIKIRRRPAFLVTFFFFVALMIVGFGEQFLREIQSDAGRFALPGAWQSIFSEPSVLGLFFSATILILLITSEFNWRTARQNVIDGMSKEQWFAAKLLLVPAIAILFIVAQAGIGGTLAGLATDLRAPGASVIGPHDLQALAGVALASLGMTAMGFLFAFLVRSPGPAIALFFLYIAVIEQLVLVTLLRRWDALAPAVQYLPARMFFTMIEDTQYYPEAVARAVRAAEEAGRAAPVFADTGSLMMAAAVYAVVFVGIAFLVYRRRDL